MYPEPQRRGKLKCSGSWEDKRSLEELCCLLGIIDLATRADRRDPSDRGRAPDESKGSEIRRRIRFICKSIGEKQKVDRSGGGWEEGIPKSEMKSTVFDEEHGGEVVKQTIPAAARIRAKQSHHANSQPTRLSRVAVCLGDIKGRRVRRWWKCNFHETFSNE